MPKILRRCYLIRPNGPVRIVTTEGLDKHALIVSVKDFKAMLLADTFRETIVRPIEPASSMRPLEGLTAFEQTFLKRERG